MKNILVILLVITIISCQEKNTRIESIEFENLTAVQIDSILTDFNFQYESPIILDCTDMVLIPISTKIFESRKIYSKDGYYSDDYPRYWNVLFYNRQTSETRLLTEKKIRISQIHAKFVEYESVKRTLEGKVLYQIGDTDYNNDKKLNSIDPEFLFVSDIDGRRLKRLSPQNEDLQYYEVIPNSEQILIRTLRDVNRDSIFNNYDELILYKLEFSKNEWTIEEVIDSIQKKRIETMYFEQWLKKK